MPVNDVRVCLGKTAIAAHPSVTAADGDSEVVPATLLEAQARETPVFTTRHSGIPGGVEEAIAAELIDERDTFPIAEKSGSFLESLIKLALSVKPVVAS